MKQFSELPLYMPIELFAKVVFSNTSSNSVASLHSATVSADLNTKLWNATLVTFNFEFFITKSVQFLLHFIIGRPLIP
jgi:hypothetical protein